MPKKNPKHLKKTRSPPSNLSALGKKKIAAVKKQKLNIKKCSVEGCDRPSVHSLSLMEYQTSIDKAGLKMIIPKGSRKFNICKEHYKAIKTHKKKEDKIKRLRFGAQKNIKMKPSKIP